MGIVEMNQKWQDVSFKGRLFVFSTGGGQKRKKHVKNCKDDVVAGKILDITTCFS